METFAAMLTRVGKLTVPQLKAECKQHGITGYSKLNSRELFNLVLNYHRNHINVDTPASEPIQTVIETTAPPPQIIKPEIESADETISPKQEQPPTQVTSIDTNATSTNATSTNTELDATIKSVCEHIAKSETAGIALLRSKEVIQWLFGDVSFLKLDTQSLSKKSKKAEYDAYKLLEDEWGRNILKSSRRSDLKLDKQWTNKFGEHICEELLLLQGKPVYKPEKQKHMQPDAGSDDAIYEAKTQTYYTTGTAGEKILGCPFKYAEIPDLYNKPLVIVCIGGAERVCRQEYGNLPGPVTNPAKQRFLDFFKANRIEYIGVTDILKKIIKPESS